MSTTYGDIANINKRLALGRMERSVPFGQNCVLINVQVSSFNDILALQASMSNAQPFPFVTSHYISTPSANSPAPYQS